MSNLIKSINTDNTKKFSAIILAAEESTPIDECVNVIDFANKYSYNIGINVDKLKIEYIMQNQKVKRLLLEVLCFTYSFNSSLFCF